jgi:hypothetical protein
MKGKIVLLASLMATSTAWNPASAQFNTPCVQRCYDSYFAVMNQCQWSSNPSICNAHNQTALSECKNDCVEPTIGSRSEDPSPVLRPDQP